MSDKDILLSIYTRMDEIDNLFDQLNEKYDKTTSEKERYQIGKEIDELYKEYKKKRKEADLYEYKVEHNGKNPNFFTKLFYAISNAFKQLHDYITNTKEVASLDRDKYGLGNKAIRNEVAKQEFKRQDERIIYDKHKTVIPIFEIDGKGQNDGPTEVEKEKILSNETITDEMKLEQIAALSNKTGAILFVQFKDNEVFKVQPEKTMFKNKDVPYDYVRVELYKPNKEITKDNGETTWDSKGVLATYSFNGLKKGQIYNRDASNIQKLHDLLMQEGINYRYNHQELTRKEENSDWKSPFISTNQNTQISLLGINRKLTHQAALYEREVWVHKVEEEKAKEREENRSKQSKEREERRFNHNQEQQDRSGQGKTDQTNNHYQNQQSESEYENSNENIKVSKKDLVKQHEKSHPFIFNEKGMQYLDDMDLNGVQEQGRDYFYQMMNEIGKDMSGVFELNNGAEIKINKVNDKNEKGIFIDYEDNGDNPLLLTNIQLNSSNIRSWMAFLGDESIDRKPMVKFYEGTKEIEKDMRGNVIPEEMQEEYNSPDDFCKSEFDMPEPKSALQEELDRDGFSDPEH